MTGRERRPAFEGLIEAEVLHLVAEPLKLGADAERDRGGAE